jgi:hypothetical protein
MQISWKLTRDTIPDALWQPQDLTALDGDQVIGRVYRIEHGPGEGLWHWTLMAASHNSCSTSLVSGHERERGRAGRRLLEAYQVLSQSRTRGAA